jgi:hypothetical protein
MIGSYFSAWQIKFSLILFLALFNSIAYSPRSEAASHPLTNNISENVRVSFNPPPVADNGAPGGRQKGAGSHSLCKLSDRQTEVAPLIALMPEIPVGDGMKGKTYVWGKTTVAHPTFWFYVAYPPNTYVEFVLQDEEENEFYQTSFTLNETSGAIGVTLPQEKAALQVGKSYHWYFNIICDRESSTDDFVEGWIERVQLNPIVNNQLKLAQPLERVAIYAENGLWYDTLTNLDRLRQTEPKNQAIAQMWSDLLRQVGLEEIAFEPVVGRYSLEN